MQVTSTRKIKFNVTLKQIEQMFLTHHQSHSINKEEAYRSKPTVKTLRKMAPYRIEKMVTQLNLVNAITNIVNSEEENSEHLVKKDMILDDDMYKEQIEIL